MGATAWNRRGKGKHGGKYKGGAAQPAATRDPKEQSQPSAAPRASYASVLRAGLEGSGGSPKATPQQPEAIDQPVAPNNESEVDSTSSDGAPTPSVDSCETALSSLPPSSPAPSEGEPNQLTTHDPYRTLPTEGSPTAPPLAPSADRLPYTIGYPTPPPVQSPQYSPNYYSYPPSPPLPIGCGAYGAPMGYQQGPYQGNYPQTGWNGYPQAQPPAQYQIRPGPYASACPPAPSGGNPQAQGISPPTDSRTHSTHGNPASVEADPPNSEGYSGIGGQPNSSHYDPQCYYGYNEGTPYAQPAETHPCLRLYECCMYLDHCRFQDLPREWCLKCLKGWQHEECDGEAVPADYQGWGKRSQM